MIKTIGRLLPRERVRKIEKLAASAGMEASGEEISGYLIIFSLIFFILSTVFLLNFPDSKSFIEEISFSINPAYAGALSPLIAILISLLIVVPFFLLMVYTYLSLRAEARRMAVESILPDFLTLVAANVRAGMPLDQAMWQASKPEFGLLAEETKSTIKSSFGGEPLDDALDRLAMKFDSRLISRTIELLKQALASGGEVATILEKTAEEAREGMLVKKEIQASLIIYIIFLFFAAAIGTPFLFAVSEKLLVVLHSAFAFVPQTAETSALTGLTPTSPPITAKDFHYFALFSMLVTSLFGSFIIGVIQTGSRNQGLRYFPFILLIAYLVFFFASSLLDAFFAGFIA
ncbi:MAG: type II secretion system F family protein [Candidatus Anstonellales archaeon]